MGLERNILDFIRDRKIVNLGEIFDMFGKEKGYASIMEGIVMGTVTGYDGEPAVLLAKNRKVPELIKEFEIVYRTDDGKPVDMSMARKYFNNPSKYTNLSVRKLTANFGDNSRAVYLYPSYMEEELIAQGILGGALPTLDFENVSNLGKNVEVYHGRMRKKLKNNFN